MKKVKYAYTCVIDFQQELDEDLPNGIRIYPTYEALKKAHPCCDQCGVLRIKLEIDSEKRND